MFAPIAAALALIASVALDLANATPIAPVPSERDLELIPVEDAGRLGARLTNRSDHKLTVLLGWSCAIESPFTAIIDGARRSFAPEAACEGEALPMLKMLQPSESALLLAPHIQLDRRARRPVTLSYVVERPRNPGHWFGTLRSRPMVPVPLASLDGDRDVAKLLRVDVRLDGADVVVDHVVRAGAPPRRYFVGWKGACPSWNTQLFADGTRVDEWPIAPTVCDGPVMPDTRLLAGGERFTVRGPLPTKLRGRTIRARFEVPPSAAADLPIGDGPPVAVGTVESDPLASRAPSSSPVELSIRIEGDELVVKHRVTSSGQFLVGWKGACTTVQTTLVVDGTAVLGWPAMQRGCLNPSKPEWRQFAVGARWFVRDTIPKSLRGRTVRARYRVSDETLARARRIERHSHTFPALDVESNAVTVPR